MVAALLLSGLASPVWENFERPALTWLRDIVLTIGTLGITSLVDQMYADVGNGSYERSSSTLLNVFSFLGLATIIVFVLSLFNLKSVVDNVGQHRSHVERYERHLLRTSTRYKFLLRMFTPMLWLNVCVSVVFVVISAVTLASLNFETEAAAGLERYQNIVGPYISENDRLMFKYV